MIVKNEEAFLGRCLDSVKDHVDEIIIVDTGSTDCTVEIAEKYGARIYHHPWEHDFSKHRNQSLAYATGEWIFQIDADEELFAEDGPLLRQIAQEGQADYYHCQFYDIKRDGTVHGVFNLIRFFRNGIGMGYERRVHNQLQTRGEGAYSRIRIRHYGYDLSPEQMEAKHIRTTTLLKQMIETDPQDAYSLYQLASSYSMHREFDQAVRYGERALQIRRQNRMANGYFLTTYHTVAQGYYALGRIADAERIGLEALDTFPLHLDICHLLAQLYFKTRSLEPCRQLSLRYLHIHAALTKDPTLLGSFYCHSLSKRNEILFGLGCIHFLERDMETADRYFRESLPEADRPRKRAGHICRLYLDKQVYEKAMQWLILACGEALDPRERDLSSGAMGALAYDVAEAFCKDCQWGFAESALQLALHVTPEGFDPKRFHPLLQGTGSAAPPAE
jgi:glycosyltransferase involved in cell wall biosynthesis